MRVRACVVTAAIIPSDAHAKIVFRLVAGQDPEAVYKSLQDHIASVAPSLAEGLRVEVKRFGSGARAYQVRPIARMCVCVCVSSSEIVRLAIASVCTSCDEHDE